MRASVEISKYPLTESYEQPVLDFIERITSYDGLEVYVNNISTQIFGEYDVLMDALTKEMRKSWEEHGKAIFVAKFLGADLSPDNG